MAGRQGRQVREHLAPALGQNRAAPDTVGHVTAHLSADFLQVLPAHLRREGPAEHPQYRRAVTAPPSHTGAHRDVLSDVDREPPLRQSGLPKEGGGGLSGDIPLPLGEEGQVGSDVQPRLRQELHRHLVRQRHRLHHHPHVVVAVGTLAQNVQGQIQFCIGRFRARHGWSLSPQLGQYRLVFVPRCLRQWGQRLR